MRVHTAAPGPSSPLQESARPDTVKVDAGISQSPTRPERVAIMPWGHTIEEFLDSIGVSLTQFCEEMDGGWLFGYVQALQRAGFEVAIFCISSTLSISETRRHRASGADLVLIPASTMYRRLRSLVTNPYAGNLKTMFAGSRLPRRLRGPLCDLLPYFATPRKLLRRELRRASIDLIIAQEYEYARFDALVSIGRELGLPVFATFQGGNWQASRLERFIRPRSIRRCAGLLIAPGDEVARVQAAYGVPPEKICRAHNPLDLAQWKGVPRSQARAELGLPLSARIVISHGRIDIHRKGLDILLEAWRGLRSRNATEDWRLILIGSGNDAPVFREQLNALGDSSLLWIDRYLRDRPLLRTWLSAADVYVMASRHEGFPVAPLEAMACGLPIVATDVPGMREIMGEGAAVPGIVVATEDAPALATALEQTLSDATFRSAVSSRAQKRIEVFSLDEVGGQLRTFIRTRCDSQG